MTRTGFAPPVAKPGALESGGALAFSYISLSLGTSDLYLLDHRQGIVKVANSNRHDVSPLHDPDPESLVDPPYIAEWGSSAGRKVASFATDSSMARSPDSSKLALVTLGEDYRSFDSTEGSAIYVLNAAGSAARKANEPNGLIYDISWRP